MAKDSSFSGLDQDPEFASHGNHLLQCDNEVFEVRETVCADRRTCTPDDRHWGSAG